MEDPNKKSNIFERKSSHWLASAILVALVIRVLKEIYTITSMQWIFYLCMLLFVIGMTCAIIGIVCVIKERTRGDY